VGREEKRGKEKKEQGRGGTFIIIVGAFLCENLFFHNSKAKPYIGFNSQRKFLGKTSIKMPTSLAKHTKICK
jgi:hypothetical protein